MCRLRDIRMARGLSQNKLANKCDVSIDTIRKLEYGVNNINNASVRTVIMLSGTFGLTVEEFMNEVII